MTARTAGAALVALLLSAHLPIDYVAVAADSVSPNKQASMTDWHGRYGGVPAFDRLNASDLTASMDEAMAAYRAELATIRDNPSSPTFENVFEALERAGDQLDRARAMWGVLTGNLSSPEVRALEKQIGPKLTALSDETVADPKILPRIIVVHENRKNLNLAPEQRRLVERYHGLAVRRGGLLAAPERVRLGEINRELQGAFADFSAKILADENSWIALTRHQASDLPAGFRSSLQRAAEERGVAGGWIVLNTRSSVNALLTYSSDRSLRERVWRGYARRGNNGDANDTGMTIRRILALRHERARLLGYANHAQYRMADTMAADPRTARDLMMRVWPAVRAKAKSEMAEIEAVARAAGATYPLAPWDYRYFTELLKKKKYEVDAASLAPFLKLDNMLAAALYAAEKLFDLKFEEDTGAVPLFHADVRSFVVRDARSGSFVGRFYYDPFARTGKKSGAWTSIYRQQRGLGGHRFPIVANSTNFIRGGQGSSTLISISDAESLFHEVGHAVHFLLQDVEYPILADAPGDFLEVPSQLYENWLLTDEVVARFARHHETNEEMPSSLRARIEAMRSFGKGIETLSYLAPAIVDMRLHTEATVVRDPLAFDDRVRAEIGVPAQLSAGHRLSHFTHLFSSDAYSAGYYNFIWSDVMVADIWSAFLAAGGPWDRSTADRLRVTLLSTGNETERSDAYIAFRGRAPDIRSLLQSFERVESEQAGN